MPYEANHEELTAHNCHARKIAPSHDRSDDPFKNKKERTTQQKQNQKPTTNKTKTKKPTKPKAPIELRETCSEEMNALNPLEFKAQNSLELKAQNPLELKVQNTHTKQKWPQ